MKKIQVSVFGRCAPQPIEYPILDGRDPLFVLACELESYWEQGAVITPVRNVADSYVIRRTDKPHRFPVLRVRIVDVGIDEQDTAVMLPVEMDGRAVS